MARLSGGMCRASCAAPQKSPKAPAPVSTGMTRGRDEHSHRGYPARSASVTGSPAISRAPTAVAI